MAKYTFELRRLFDFYTRNTVEGWFKDYELSDYLTTEEIAVINDRGTWTKDKLAKKIVDHYLMREIGFDMVYLDESHYIKNPKSTYSEAVSVLGKAPIKRITSGTIIPNNPKDLFGQLRFLDPTILGKEDDFLRMYGKFEQPVDEFGDPKRDRHGNVKPPVLVGWAEGSQKRLRRLIQERGGVSIRRSMWRWRMPALEEHLHKVRLTPIQTILYRMIMENIKQILGGSKELQEAAQKLKEDNYDPNVDDDKASDSVLSKLSRFTTFLSVPESAVR